MFNTTAWLEKHAPGFGHLKEEERKTLGDFSLLWSLFEGQVLNCSARASAITSACDKLCPKKLNSAEEIKECFVYFKRRYSEGASLNSRFMELNFKKGDKRGLVAAAILGEVTHVNKILAACLIIIYRYRNNYFHGLKWAYEFRNQYENFYHSNRLLARVMELAAG